MNDLPPPRVAGRYRVAVVCLGNICRSPTIATVLRHRLDVAGLTGAVDVVSGGTGAWHLGEPMDPRAATTLLTAGYDETEVRGHRARRYDGGWAAEADLVLAMDDDNLADVTEAARGAGAEEPGRLRLFGAWDPLDPGTAVPDPYYGGDDGFEEVLAMVERTTERLVTALVLLLAGPSATASRAAASRAAASRAAASRAAASRAADSRAAAFRADALRTAGPSEDRA